MNIQAEIRELTDLEVAEVSGGDVTFFSFHGYSVTAGSVAGAARWLWGKLF